MGLTQTGLRKHEIRERIHDTLLDTSTLVNDMKGSRESSMKDFLRVTLCYVQSERQRGISRLLRAERTLEEVMQQINDLLHQIESQPLEPLAYVSRLLYWRNGFDTHYSFAEILRSVCNSYDQRCCQGLNSKRISQILVLLDQCSQESNLPFYPSILAARCVVWIYSRLLALESILLLGISRAFQKIYRRLGSRIWPGGHIR